MIIKIEMALPDKFKNVKSIFEDNILFINTNSLQVNKEVVVKLTNVNGQNTLEGMGR